jgi:hypothetical protein
MSATFDLTTGSVPPPTIIEVKDGTAFTFSGLTPDGKQALTSSEPIRGTAGPNPSRLIDAKTAQVIPTPSLPVQYAVTPAFSPDGKHVGFTNEAAGNGHLAVMDFDGTQNPPFFSNLRDVAVNDAQVLSWPSFLPDSLAVVYTEGAGFESKNGPAALRSVNMASGAVSTLDSLNAAKSGLTAAKNFKPTVMPRPIGGYFWVMFSSNRTYGNTTVSGLKIWVAAFDLDHVGKQDASHPAFFLPGQAMNSLSLGPYVALEPCRALGATCESGVDCCDGFCRETSRAADGTPVLQCVPPPPASCSQVDEFCVTPADCCDQTNLCILNRCALPPPPPIF